MIIFIKLVMVSISLIVVVSGLAMLYRIWLLKKGILAGEQVFGKEEWNKMTQK